jgi:hypothetical protein
LFLILQNHCDEEILSLRGVSKNFAAVGKVILEANFAFVAEFKEISTKFTDNCRKGSRPEITAQNFELAAQTLIALRKSAGQRFMSEERVNGFLDRFRLRYYDDLSLMSNRPESLWQLEFRAHPEHWPLCCVLHALKHADSPCLEYEGTLFSPLLKQKEEIEKRIWEISEKASLERRLLVRELIDRDNYYFTVLMGSIITFICKNSPNLTTAIEILDVISENSEGIEEGERCSLLTAYGLLENHASVIALYEKYPHILDGISDGEEPTSIARAYAAQNRVSEALEMYKQVEEFDASYLEKRDHAYIKANTIEQQGKSEPAPRV